MSCPCTRYLVIQGVLSTHLYQLGTCTLRRMDGGSGLLYMGKGSVDSLEDGGSAGGAEKHQIASPTFASKK